MITIVFFFSKLRRRRLEKFSSGSASKSQNATDANDKHVSTQLSNELASKIFNHSVKQQMIVFSYSMSN